MTGVQRVRIFPTADALGAALAEVVANVLAKTPSSVLGLPTGRTPIPLYRHLIDLHRLGRIDFRRATTFNLDEFVGLGQGDAGSYRTFMRKHLFDAVGLSPRRAHFLNGRARDLDKECERYERAIRRAGGIDLQILGLGTNGHIGFNEPARALSARTHRVQLRTATRQANASLFDHRWTRVPREGLSMGMSTILEARRIVLIATGATKARAVERMIHGPVTTGMPASFLQLHPHADVWVDSDAAARLKGSGGIR